MLKTTFALVFLIFFFAACEKSDPTPSTPVPEPSTLELISDKQWVYDEIYQNFNGSTGTLIYKRGSAANKENWDAARVIFWTNGLADEWGPTGIYVQGFWELNMDSTLLHYTNINSINNASRIITLNESNYIWYDSINRVKGKMVIK